MKYFKTKFLIKSTDGSILSHEMLNTARELCAALAGYAGYESFEDSACGIDGYVQQNLLDRDALEASFNEFPIEEITVEYSTSEAEDKNWNEAWEKEGFSPIIIGNKCRIHDIYHPVEKNDEFAVDIEIDAKQAFGTGTHNTTRMIVGEMLDMDIKSKHVLDCGCGTGILSIVAAKCGAGKITAYDIDEWSVDNTRHNAAINNVHNIDVMLGDVNIIKGIEEKYDIVLANINRNILLNDMPALSQKMKSGTVFIISGFYSEDVPVLKEKAASLGLAYDSMNSSENWTLLKFIKS